MPPPCPERLVWKKCSAVYMVEFILDQFCSTML
jgi:hypothetical protein